MKPVIACIVEGYGDVPSVPVLIRQIAAISERLDQPALAAQFDLEEAKQHSRSFRKCYKEIKRLIEELRTKEPQ